jgi:LuxR family transcriptional regulator, maltose regulon positive regulatory protein
MAVTGHAVLLATDVGRRPRAGRTIHRPRVQALLETSIHARLVLVAAPAGYGKSTLLVSWLEGAPIRAGWLSLDPHDDDAVRFARALEATAELIHASTGEPAASDPARPVDLDLALGSVLQQLADAVAGGPSGGVALVLDDYHVISQPAIHRFVGDLVARLPPGVRLVLATRSDPPLPLARLRARGELVEIRAADLRFSEEEADALLRAAGVELLQGEVAELAERTEGWAAALRLAAVALREGTDRSARVHRFGASHRFVLDYIVEEVLAGLSSESQAFLLRTSILERLCGPLCDAVTGAADGQRLLETFERLNLLTVPLDDERRWFRYHALFAEVLRARLGALHPDEVLELHARAAAWYASQADDDGAVFHVLRSGDTERACQVLADASLRRLNAGDLSTVRRWLDALPAESVRAHPQLSLSYAWCLALAGETDGVAERLADAERAVAQDAGDADAGVLRTQAALLRSRLADLQGDPQAAAEHARLALDLLPSGLPLVAEATLRGDATVLLARALVAAGDARGAAAAYLASLPDLRAGGNAFAAGRAVADLAALDIERGDPMSAARRCEAEIARSRTEPPGAVAGSVWAALARARLALRQVDLAEAAALQGLAVATRTGDAQVARSVERTLERVAVARTPAGSRVQGRSRAGRPGLEEPLTPRETEVLALVALGRSNSQIAGELFVSVGTVKSHLHTISGKLAAANRVEAVARARALGLLP